MAKSVQAYTWENGFAELSTGSPWGRECSADDEEGVFVTPPAREIVTSDGHNDHGINVLRTWPTLYDGTNDPHGVPDWFKPSNEVDVIICGAGPSGLEVAVSLVRQGISFRIIDKAQTPLIAGRADGVQPRFLEILHSWGLAQEVHEEGPLIERTAIYKDGKKLFFNRSHQSDSRYRGLHIQTQGQIERIYIRDLVRHRVLVERSSTLKHFNVEDTGTHPVRATILNNRTGKEEEVCAKFLVGSDGASSIVRKGLGIPFDGISTDIYWGIMDCIYETDYPHAWCFGSVISSKYGGCVIIPREDGYIRLYTQLDVSATGPLAASRQVNENSFAEVGGKIDIHTITPEEVLAQANRIFSPYKVKFGAPLSWFAIWKISERVARSFSSNDQRVHLVGDAAHIHSVMGAFGLNASIMDACNLGWKMGLVCKGKAPLEKLMETYNYERRDQACRIIQVSGEYLRFVCDTSLPMIDLQRAQEGIKMVARTVGRGGVNGSSARNEEEQENGHHDSSEKPALVGVSRPNGHVPAGQLRGHHEDEEHLLNGAWAPMHSGDVDGASMPNGHDPTGPEGGSYGDDGTPTPSAPSSVDGPAPTKGPSELNGPEQGDGAPEPEMPALPDADTLAKEMKRLATFVGRTQPTWLGVEEPSEGLASDWDTQATDKIFLGSFFGRNGAFLLGVEAPFDESVLTPPTPERARRAVSVANGRRAPNPRVCFAANETGYLYDKMTGAARFHLVIFGSNLRGRARRRVSSFAAGALGSPNGFYNRFGGSSTFNVVVVLSCLPDEIEGLMAEPELNMLRKAATVVCDDRAPDESAHYTYGVSHKDGALVVVRPDLWVGTSALPDSTDELDGYFSGFLTSERGR